jgi:hypothetical protein
LCLASFSRARQASAIEIRFGVTLRSRSLDARG